MQLCPLPKGKITFITTSRDDKFVAVGLSNLVYLCEFNELGQIWNTILLIEGFQKPQEVRSQVGSFTTDCSQIVISTQRYDEMRSNDDDVVSTLVFPCSRNTTTPVKLASCRMPTVSSPDSQQLL